MEYQLKCEIKCCRICNEFIEQTRIFINPKLEYKISKADSYYDSLEKFVISQVTK